MSFIQLWHGLFGLFFDGAAKLVEAAAEFFVTATNNFPGHDIWHDGFHYLENQPVINDTSVIDRVNNRTLKCRNFKPCN